MKNFLKKASKIITGAATAATLLAGRAMAAEAQVANPSSAENPAQAGAETAKASGMPSELVGVNGVFTKITNTVLYAVGIISVIMLIYGGLRYVVSGGDSKKVTDAKNTIMYAIIGLIISILAYAIVNFVINAVGGEATV
ncbi:hypothetical protein IKF25_00365 [Candidatus Saccharibacteria bacterium]|jgi:hypothetical protein|nr:hypothetical protein [Candidatus Saccharibacteria bacterium]